ncbi:CHAD domain-containing protein [Dactylosporangium aurantiacum]|uniref:CHAD domain-containing protein n=1 Tax=Dactylosporangium aurantiacum TaxID=35754 RepID=A0A9Q9IUX3_9ACTN|nr:CHAD domain-containing protein [Dactylosporangium aurantiacum]MDG6104403.1 CHAD domain-containing protein [Dactylosporangium aurantiacum]UWZ59413.1 CHAD domain-containing protein [Dactylosporangium aurantiacum]
MRRPARFAVGDGFTLPGLAGPGGAVTLDATCHDTPDAALAHAGVSLRQHRDGTWSLLLPGRELRRPAAGAGVVPPDLLDVLTALHRGAGLTAVRTVRTAVHVLSSAGGVLAEVRVLSGRATGRRPRAVEVVLIDGGAADLAEVEAALTAAGAVPARPGGADDPGEDDGSAGAVVTRAVRSGVARILRHDAFARLRETMPNGDTPVHQMRVGTRRLRSDLQTFQALLDPAWSRPLRAELGRLAGALGGARDVEVMRARLRLTAAADPLAPLDTEAVERIDAALAGRQETALSALDEALRSPRYVPLLDALTRPPRLAGKHTAPAARVLPGLVRKPWRKLYDAAEALSPHLPDDDWHEVRKLAKRARYAADAAAPVVGAEAAALAKRIAKAQKILGEHQDAATAADTWLFVARFLDRGEHRLAVTAGRLFERERAAVTRARAAFPAVWAAVCEENTTAWLR